MATVDFNNPVASQSRLAVLQSIRDHVAAVSRFFDGDTLVNTQVGTVRFNTTTKLFERWGGSSWSALDTNYARKDVSNTFSAEQILETSSATAYWVVRAQNNPGFAWWANAPAVDNRRWSAHMSGSNLEIRSYNDALSSSQIALQFSRSGVTPTHIDTYSSITAGGTQSGIGRVGLVVGTAARTGYIAFYDLNNNRQGYVGYSSTTGGTDTGVVEYVAGLHQFGGNIEVAGVSRRIYGDFSSATVANRALFQTSVANGSTALGVIPNGTGTVGAYNAYASSDPANSSFAQLVAVGGTEVRVVSNQNGSGALLPMRFYMGGNVAAEISTNRNVTINAPASGNPLDARWSADDGVVLGGTSTNVSSRVSLGREGISVFGVFYDRSTGNGGLWHGTSAAGSRTDRVVITPQGNVTINQPSSGTALQVTSVSSFNPSSNSTAALRVAGPYGGGIVLENTGLWGLWLDGSGANMHFGTSSGGAFTTRVTMSTGNARFSVIGSARTTPVSVSFSSTPTFDAAQSNVFYFGTLTGNVTSMTVNNLSDGQTINIRFVQDGTGGRTVTPPSGSQISGSINSAANSVTWLVATYVASASRLEGTWTRVS